MVKEKLECEDLVILLDKDYIVDINYKDESIDLPETLKVRIKDNWDEYGFRFTNGDIFFIKDYYVNKIDKKVILDVCNSKYDHYLYTRYHDEYDEYSCVNLWSGAVIETVDGKLVLGVMSDETVSEGELHISGGSTDRDDLIENKIDYYKTMKRELYEEVGLELDDKRIIKDFYLKYLKVPSATEEELSLGVLYKIDLNISFEKLNNKFEEYKKYLIDNGLEVEFTKLYGIDKTEESIIKINEKFLNKIPKYIIQMFLKEIKGKK